MVVLTVAVSLTSGLGDNELRDSLKRWLEDARGEQNAMIGAFLRHAVETDVERVKAE